MTLREKIEVMQAFERGEEIEFIFSNRNNWTTLIRPPSWNWDIYKYRIKPKPKQTVVIEKWLVKRGFSPYHSKIVEASGEFIELHYAKEDKIKLLDTYEVEL